MKTSPTFEDALTRGQAQWLTSVHHDPVTREFVVGLTHDPEHSAPQRAVHFADVHSVADSWIDRDDECMEGLLGAYEEPTSSGVLYTLVTDQREITLSAAKRARIDDG